jgi:excisionase family DNA binding protein
MREQEKVEWVTVDDVAAAFQVHNTTVGRELAKGHIPHYRFGNSVRIPRSWLDGELDRFRRGATVEEDSQTALIEEGRRIARALAAAERVGAL